MTSANDSWFYRVKSFYLISDYLPAFQGETLHTRGLCRDGGESSIFVQQSLFTEELPSLQQTHSSLDTVTFALGDQHCAAADYVKLVTFVPLSYYWCTG